MIIEQAARRLALPTNYLLKLATTASHRYKTYAIPKKTGGERIINHPARELKLVQSWLLHNVLATLPIHPAATAYRTGSNIQRNALPHADKNYLLRVDFQDFFPSLKRDDVTGILNANRHRFANIVSDVDIFFITMIVCRGNSLTIGAPTSPHLSNAIMFEFDEIWSRNTQAVGVTYTRYADDLYFSTNSPHVLEGVLKHLRASLAETRSPILHINDRKTAFSSRKRRKLVTGLVLTPTRTISIGRKKKRILKSLVWQLTRGELTSAQAASLQGWVSYVNSVEPRFVDSLQRKYKLDLTSAQTWKT